MKIGFVLDDSLDKPDGVQQYVLTLGSWFSAQGHEVHYLVGQSSRSDLPNIHSLAKNLGVRFNKNRLSIPLPASRRQLKTLLHRENFDVLHVQMPYSPFLAGRIINGAPDGTVVFGTFHIIPYSTLEKAASRLLRLLIGRSLKKFDKVVSVSQPAAVFAENVFKLPSEVVPNAVDIARFENAPPLKRYDDSKITVLFLGRLVERKGAMEFLLAIAKLRDQGKLSGVRVVVCGAGPLETSLKGYVAAASLGSVVEFTGFIPEEDKPSYLAAADIAVFPSIGGESFGIVLIEAMAAGTHVVIGGDNVGYSAVLGDKNERLVNPKDTDAFARKLAHYIFDGTARQASYVWQVQHVKQYDAATVGSKIEQLYREAVAKNGRQPDNGGKA